MQAGDEIASLNEETRRIVWSKVNALMDMGVKMTCRLKTESGREIRTTANHPYLTKHGWTKAAFLKEGVEIAVPRELFARAGAERGVGHDRDRENQNGEREIKNLHTVV